MSSATTSWPRSGSITPASASRTCSLVICVTVEHSWPAARYWTSAAPVRAKLALALVDPRDIEDRTTWAKPSGAHRESPAEQILRARKVADHAVEQPRRRLAGWRRPGALGRTPRRRAAAARPRGAAPAQSGEGQAPVPRWGGRRLRRQSPRAGADPADRARDLAGQWLLSRTARRAGRGAALRRMDQDHATRPELAPAVADRNRVHAQGHPRQPGGGRLHRPVRGGPQRLDARRAQRKPDAHRRREHRRHQFRAVVADQGRRPVPVQRPRPGADGQGGRRERDARDHRQDADRRGDDRRPRCDRARRARADPADPRRLRRRHPGHPGAAAEGRPAERGDRRLPRRAARPGRPRARAERGGNVRQRHPAACPRRGGAPAPGSPGLPPGGGRQGGWRCPALRRGLRRVRQGAGRHHQADLSGDHGRRAARHEQGA